MRVVRASRRAIGRAAGVGVLMATVACGGAPVTTPKTAASTPAAPLATIAVTAGSPVAAQPTIPAAASPAAAAKQAASPAGASGSPAPAAQAAAVPGSSPTAGASSPAPSPRPAASPVAGQLRTTAPAPASPGATCWDVQDPTRASFTIGETLANLGRLTSSTGTTSDVGGSLCLRDGQVVDGGASRVLVGLGSIQTELPARDIVIHNDLLKTATYPVATYTIDRVEGIGPAFPADGPVNGRLIGRLRLLAIEVPLPFTVRGEVKGDTVAGTATATAKPSDFGVAVPDLADVVKVEDSVELRLDFTARRR